MPNIINQLRCTYDHIFKSSLCIITPVYNENPEIFREALSSWEYNSPNEVMAVMNESDAIVLKSSSSFQKQRVDQALNHPKRVRERRY